MKRILVLALFSIAIALSAENPKLNTETMSGWVTATGPVTPVLDLTKDKKPVSITVWVNLTLAASCNFQVESSEDNKTWIPGVLNNRPCPPTQDAHFVLPYVAHNYLRVNVTKYDSAAAHQTDLEKKRLAALPASKLPAPIIGVRFGFKHGETAHNHWRKGLAPHIAKVKQ